MKENLEKLVLFKRRYGWWFFVSLTILVFWLPLNIAEGQTTGLSVVPSENTIYLNGSNSTNLSFYATGVSDLMAYDITFTYDPGIVQLVSYANAGWLTPAYQFYVDNRPGFLRISFGKVGLPGVFGDGALLNLTFRGVGYGVSPVTIIEAGFSNRTGVVTNPTFQNGSITTKYASTPVILSSLSGKISLQGQIQRGNISLSLGQGQYVGQGPFLIRSTNTISGNLNLSSLPMDAYLITTNQPRYLNLSAASNKVKGILTTPTTLSSLTLLAGDLNGDGQISVLDLALVAGTFGQSGSALSGDVNFDGTVNARDLALVAGNFGLTSASAYAGWIP